VTPPALRLGLAAILATAACHSAPPATAPAPAASPPAAAAAPDSGRHSLARDSTARDSAGIPEVTSTAVAIFGDSVATVETDSGAPPPAAVATPTVPAAKPVTWDIDVRSHETRERVTYYVKRFQGEARPRFTAWLQRGGRYEPMIRAKLCAAGLPEDLTYLALIESGYDPNAYSSAAAVGIWQLMTGTAQGTGLRVDWWIDERRDPVRSTDGAIKFLGWLNQQFGSLYLAAAAYNGGPGRVARGLTRYADDLEGRSGDDRFFALAETDYLRAETRDYVPKLIAAALVAKEPAKYGITVTLDAPLAYDSVDPGPAVALATVARAAGVSLSSVLELNYQILRGMTPPAGKWRVRIPVGSAARFDSAFAAMNSQDRAGAKRVTIEKGTTIATLKTKYHITTRQFMWYNPTYRKTTTGKVPAGRTILIPTAATLAGARDVPDPAIEKYGKSRRHSVTHVVKKGESLDAIAARNGTSAKALRKLNGLKTNAIYPGQVLIIKPGRKR
jgi:membrane-bound lytic murein transglycosylase D